MAFFGTKEVEKILKLTDQDTLKTILIVLVEILFHLRFVTEVDFSEANLGEKLNL